VVGYGVEADEDVGVGFRAVRGVVADGFLWNLDVLRIRLGSLEARVDGLGIWILTFTLPAAFAFGSGVLRVGFSEPAQETTTYQLPSLSLW